MIRVFIADDAAVALGNMRRLVTAQPDMQVVGTAADGTSAVASAMDVRPDVLVVDVELPGVDGLKAAQLIRSGHPACRVLAMGLDDDDEAVAQARAGGADEYLVKPFAGLELVEAIRRLGTVEVASVHSPQPPPAPHAPQQPATEEELQAALNRAAAAAVPPLFFGAEPKPSPEPAPQPAPEHPAAGKSKAGWSPFGPSLLSTEARRPAEPPPPPRAAPPPPRAQPVPVELAGPGTAEPAYTPQSLGVEPAAELPLLPDRVGTGTVIAVTAGKGGVGTTVIAVNLAILLARESGRSVALLDLELQHGDAAALLRLNPGDDVMTLGDLIRLDQLGDVQALRRALVRSEYGIHVLLSATRGSRGVDATCVREVLAGLRQSCDYIVVDVPRQVGPAQAAALRDADQLVVVSGMSDPAVRATQRVLAGLEELRPRAGRPLILLNRSEANSDFTRESVEQALGRPVALQLPYDAIVVGTSVNRGAPFVAANPDAPATRRVRQLATMLVPELPQPIEAQEPMGEIVVGPPKRRRRGLFGFARA